MDDKFIYDLRSSGKVLNKEGIFREPSLVPGIPI
jgi:hypothetical protein